MTASPAPEATREARYVAVLAEHRYALGYEGFVTDGDVAWLHCTCGWKETYAMPQDDLKFVQDRWNAHLAAALAAVDDEQADKAVRDGFYGREAADEDVLDSACRARPAVPHSWDGEDPTGETPLLFSDLRILTNIASYGMPVGATIFDTCRWVGRYEQAHLDTRHGSDPQLVYRADVKMHLNHATNGNDATIRQALVDRFSPGVRNHGKGTKDGPGWFYGFSGDVWAAFAVGVYTIDHMEAI